MSAANEAARKAAYDRSDCPNGPDEHGDYPCDPQVIYGGGHAECQVCDRVASWGSGVAAASSGDTETGR